MSEKERDEREEQCSYRRAFFSSCEPLRDAGKRHPLALSPTGARSYRVTHAVGTVVHVSVEILGKTNQGQGIRKHPRYSVSSSNVVTVTKPSQTGHQVTRHAQTMKRVLSTLCSVGEAKTASLVPHLVLSVVFGLSARCAT